MGLRKKVGETAVPKVFDFSTRGQASQMSNDERSEVSWVVRRLHELGVLEMAASTTNKPSGFFLNYSTALFYLTVIAAIAGGFWFMHDRIATANFERGREVERRVAQEKEMQEFQKKMLILEEKLKQAGGQ